MHGMKQSAVHCSGGVGLPAGPLATRLAEFLDLVLCSRNTRSCTALSPSTVTTCTGTSNIDKELYTIRNSCRENYIDCMHSSTSMIWND